MAALSDSLTNRVESERIVRREVGADDIVYRGSLLEWSSGDVLPLSGAGDFAGIAAEEVDNTGGSAGAKKVDVRVYSLEERSVTGLSAETKFGQRVFATTDGDLTLTPVAASTWVGRVVQWISGTTGLIEFDAVAVMNQPLQRLASASFSIGSEAANAITVAVQLLDEDGNDMVSIQGVKAYLSSDAAGGTLEPDSATLSITAGTDGIAIPLADTDGIGSTAAFLVSEADGDIDVVITQTSGADTHYLNLIMPDGSIVTSGAITFA